MVCDISDSGPVNTIIPMGYIAHLYSATIIIPKAHFIPLLET